MNSNMRTATRFTTLALAAALIWVAGCGPSEPLQVTTLQLGRSLNSDDSVGTHTTRFSPSDTIYVSALSDRPGRGTLTVHWFLHGQMVSEASRDVSYRRASATEFHLQNSGGFPVGQYRVDLLLNGEVVESRQFRVE
jgi:hypothetical protein